MATDELRGGFCWKPRDHKGPCGPTEHPVKAGAACGLAYLDDDEPAYAYTFSGEAGETFQNVGRNHFVGYSARIYPHPELGGDPFDAAYLGPDDAEEWYDAVKFRRLDDVGEPIAGAPVESMRVARVHFF